VTSREGDETKISAYNKNILYAMPPPSANGFEFSIFYFIWEEIKVISENPLELCICSLFHAYDRASDNSHILL
jgi:hypothetical protein